MTAWLNKLNTTITNTKTKVASPICTGDTPAGSAPPLVRPVNQEAANWIGREAVTPIRKRVGKLPVSSDADWLMTRPMRKSLSAKRADIAVFVMEASLNLVLDRDCTQTRTGLSHKQEQGIS